MLRKTSKLYLRFSADHEENHRCRLREQRPEYAKASMDTVWSRVVRLVQNPENPVPAEESYNCRSWVSTLDRLPTTEALDI